MSAGRMLFCLYPLRADWGTFFRLHKINGGIEMVIFFIEADRTFRILVHSGKMVVELVTRHRNIPRQSRIRHISF